MGWAAASKASAESCELCRRRKSCTHELDFVENPKGVIIQQTEVHRPARTIHAIAAIERAGEQHVLRADEDGFTLRVDVPFARVFAAHEDDRAVRVEPFERGVVGVFSDKMSEPLLYFLVRLLHECPHRQAIDEAAGPRGVESRGLRVESRLQYSIPQPREDDGCGLAEAGGDVDEA